MHDAVAAIAEVITLASTSTPTPTEETVDPALVTPGPAGFVVIALLSLVVVALVWDMMRRIRRGRVRADINEQLDAEARAEAEAEAEAQDAAAPAAGAPDGDSPDGESAEGGSTRR